MAVESGNVNCVKLFLKTAEMVNAVEETWGFTPLHLAANLGKEDVVKALVQAGASFYRRTKVFVAHTFSIFPMEFVEKSNGGRIGVGEQTRAHRRVFATRAIERSWAMHL